MARSNEEYSNESSGYPSEDRTIYNVGTITAGTISVLQSTSPWVSSGTVTTLPSGTQDVSLVNQTYVPLLAQLYSGSNVSGSVTSLITGLVDDTNYRGVRLDKSTHATTTIEYEHHEIHAGNHYMVTGFSTVGMGGTLNFGVTTPNTSVWSHMCFEIEGTNQTEFRVYETCTYSGGTTTTPFNNNRNSSSTSVLSIAFNPNSVTTGTLIFSQSKGLAGATPSKASIEGIIDRSKEIILRQNEVYIFQVTSMAADNIVSYVGEWYEHTNLS